MKARWLIISLFLAFPFAFAFFLSEARLGEKRIARPALVGAPLHAPTPAAVVAEVPSPAAPEEPPAPEPAVEEQSAPPVPKSTPTPDPVATPSAVAAIPAPADEEVVILQGSYTVEDRAFVYEPDIKILLRDDVLLSSPTGVMVSDEQQKLFVGDMQMETAKNTIVASEAVLNTHSGQMTAKSVSVTFANESNQLIKMTGENVTFTLPTGKTPPEETKPATISAAPTEPPSPDATATPPSP
jgi:hypothetical protein